MTEAQKDTQRALLAAQAIIDGRRSADDVSSILVTLEHLVAILLLHLMDGDDLKAAAMLNEGLVQGVESRIALHASKSR